MTIDQSLFLKHSSSQTIPTEPELHLGPAPSLENVTPPPPKKWKFNIGDEAKIGILDQNLFKEGEDDNDNFKLRQPRGYKEEHNFALN